MACFRFDEHIMVLCLFDVYFPALVNPQNRLPIMKIVRRLGPDPHANGAQTPALNNCPDILELDSGDFCVIGIDHTQQFIDKLPPTVGCGPDERIVWIPRSTLVNARADIPQA